MIDVISVRFVKRGKIYTFDADGITVEAGERVIVETSKGLDIGECTEGNHAVEEESLVQPLRPVIRVATEDDLRIAEENKQREKEAFEICKEKIIQHGLDMKLVAVECGFEGNKILFFFTSDGRVDFRDLVKDLAAVFRTRIELRQIGVRDETKMMGGLGICGRPYCCNQFLNDFEPVSTKMAKTQSMSLNPTKISGSCGRLMCCLRYEQEAYEDLVKTIPKNGAFVQTVSGYGNVVQSNILRQKIKVRMDGEGEQEVKIFDAAQVAAIPGGRPKPGEEMPDVLVYVEPEEPEDQKEDIWEAPKLFAEQAEQPETEKVVPKKTGGEPQKNRGRYRNSGGKPFQNQGGGQVRQGMAPKQSKPDGKGGRENASPQSEKKSGQSRGNRRRPNRAKGNNASNGKIE